MAMATSPTAEKKTQQEILCEFSLLFNYSVIQLNLNENEWEKGKGMRQEITYSTFFFLRFASFYLAHTNRISRFAFIHFVTLSMATNNSARTWKAIHTNVVWCQIIFGFSLCHFSSALAYRRLLSLSSWLPTVVGLVKVIFVCLFLVWNRKRKRRRHWM